MQPIQPSKRPSKLILHRANPLQRGVLQSGAEAGLESRPQGRCGRELHATHLTVRTKARAQHPSHGEPAFLPSQEGRPPPPTLAQ